MTRAVRAPLSEAPEPSGYRPCVAVLGRGWLLVGALVLGAVASVLFMKPVLLAPVAGDDRKWFPEVAVLQSWNVADEVGQLPQWWDQRIDRGRANVLTDLERRSAGRLVIETSVHTGTPTYVVLGVLKLLIAAAAVLTFAALLKTVRWRRHDGALVRLSGRTILLCTLLGGVVFALGSQPAFHEVNGRNGWVNYPTHTYGAVVSILGVTALVLWLTRVYAEGRYRLPIVLGLVALAVLTNFRYELVFTAAPLTLIALLLVPLTPADRAAEGRRAKWITGLAYVGTFTTLLVALRVYVRRVCEVDGCYTGTTPRLSSEIVHVLWQNIWSSFPGTTAPRVADFIETWGVSSDRMYAPTTISIALGICMAVAMLAGWWSARPEQSSHHVATEPETTEPETGGPETGGPDADEIARGLDEARLLLLGGLLCFLGAVGAAGVMSLSVEAQVTSELGLPYRHTVLTWAGIAWALTLGVLALGHRSPRAGTASMVALSLGVGIAAAFLLPANERSLTADRVANQATAAAFAALVNGDLSDAANTHRCRLVPEIREERDDVARFVDKAFQRYWGTDFCHR